MDFADTEQPDSETITIGERAGEVITFEYYIFGRNIPVLMHISERGGWIGAKKLDYKTGEFVFSNNYIHSIKHDTSGDANKVTKEEFYKACDSYMEIWTDDKIKEHEIQVEKNNMWFEEQRQKDGK